MRAPIWDGTMLLEGEVNWTLVFAVLAVLGHVVALVAVVAAIRNGRRGRHVTTHLDRVKQTAASTDRRLFDILNAIPVALVQTDVQGKFVFANRAAHQLLGRRDVELLGLRFHSATWGITFPDGRPIPPDMLPTARALRGQTVKGFQHLLANPSTRRKMLVSVTAMPILDEMDQVIGSTAAVVETEGLTTPEPALGEVIPLPQPAEDPMVRRLFDAAPEALVVVSPHGLVRLANRTAVGLAGEDILDADFADRFVMEAERVAVRQTLRGAPTADGAFATDFAATALDGRVFDWVVTPLADGRGRTELLVLSGSPAAVPEAEAETTEALAESAVPPTSATPEAPVAPPESQATVVDDRHNEASALTLGLTQEFGALLSVMTGAVEMMADQADQPDKVRRLAQAALGAGRKGESLSRRLAALTTGAVAGTDQALDMAALLRAQEGRLRAACPDLDLMIETPAEPVIVSLDPTGLEATTSALALNAVQAEARALSLRLSVVGDRAVLSARDDGVGMEADTLRRAPEAFFTTRAGAAGLGLSQARAFARGAGGDLEMRSEPGEGTEVRIVLPLTPADTSS